MSVPEYSTDPKRECESYESVGISIPTQGRHVERTDNPLENHTIPDLCESRRVKPGDGHGEQFGACAANLTPMGPSPATMRMVAPVSQRSGGLGSGSVCMGAKGWMRRLTPVDTATAALGGKHTSGSAASDPVCRLRRQQQASPDRIQNAIEREARHPELTERSMIRAPPESRQVVLSQVSITSNYKEEMDGRVVVAKYSAEGGRRLSL